jgi:hypothetical protein
MNTLTQREDAPVVALLPWLERRIEEMAKECLLPSSIGSLKQARTLCGIARAMLQAIRLCGTSPLLHNAASRDAQVENRESQIESGQPRVEGGVPQSIEFRCGTAAGVKGRIVFVDSSAIVSLTYMSNRTSADSLAAFWQRLGNVLQRHKRLTYLRNKKIGLQLHLPVSGIEEQLFELADRAYLEAIAVITDIPDRELVAVAKVLDALLTAEGRDRQCN